MVNQEQVFSFLTNFIMVVLGFGLAIVKEYLDKKKKEREDRERVRILIDKEMDMNAALLRELRNRVKSEQDLYKKTQKQDSYGQVTSAGDPWNVLVDFRTASLSLDVWHSQIPMLPSALTDKEVKGVFEFYSLLKRIVRLHDDYVGIYYAGLGSLALRDPFFQRVMEAINELLDTRIHIR